MAGDDPKVERALGGASILLAETEEDLHELRRAPGRRRRAAAGPALPPPAPVGFSEEDLEELTDRFTRAVDGTIERAMARAPQTSSSELSVRAPGGTGLRLSGTPPWVIALGLVVVGVAAVVGLVAWLGPW